MKHEIVMVLAGDYKPQSPLFEGDPIGGPITHDRTLAAAIFAKANNIPNIITCGGQLEGQAYPSVAHAMATHLNTTLLPGLEHSANVDVEGRSLDTVDNIRGAKEVIEQKWDLSEVTISLLTSGSHIIRAGMIARAAFGKEVLSIRGYSTGPILDRYRQTRRVSAQEERKARLIPEVGYTGVLIASTIITLSRSRGLDFYYWASHGKAASQYPTE
jgi:hypothetical protein